MASQLIVCAVKDTATQSFGTPFTVLTRNAAIRSFRAEVNSKNDSSMISTHPQDFELFVCGSFDQDAGTLAAYSAPELLVRAIDLKDQV